MDFDATVGGPDATSYVTVADATDLLEGRLYIDPWLQAALPEREAALMWATSLLDTQVVWHGTPSTTTQALAWPQTGQTDRYGRPIATDVVPGDVQQATAVYALELLRMPAPTSGSSQGWVKERRIGSTTVVYGESTTTVRVASQSIPAEIRSLLGAYGTMAGMMIVPLART